MTDLSRRSDRLELMDVEEPPRSTYAELSVINRRLGGHAVTLEALEALTPPGTRSLSVLDVGCGDGEAAELMLDWAEARGIRARVRGIDLSEAAVRLARERRRPGLSFGREDLLAPGQAYDVVHAGLVLHHCRGDDAARALAAMWGRARLGVAVNDLHRHPLAYHAIRLLTRAFSRDRLIRHDAPLSVRRGFRRGELLDLCRRAGLPQPELRWRWAFRWLLVARR